MTFFCVPHLMSKYCRAMEGRSFRLIELVVISLSPISSVSILE